MKKNGKTNILNEYIDKISSLKYLNEAGSIGEPEGKEGFRTIADDALSFVRNTLEKANATVWDKRISEIVRLSRYESVSGMLQNLRNVLESIKREIELFTQGKLV
jgi:hypothetical protein